MAPRTVRPGDVSERELGSSAPNASRTFGFLDVLEDTPELRWPNSVIMFDRMRRTDGQLRGILNAITLPIRRTRWHVRGEDCRPEVIAFVRDELGLDPEGRGRLRRKRQGIKWAEHLRHALLMLPLGFAAFEKVYEVGEPTPDLAGAMDGPVAHLRKLAPRLPRHIQELKVAPDGGLEGIVQVIRNPDGEPREVLIPVDRLVAYVYDQEGADWYGNSILRSSYAHWVIKQTLLRLGPMAVERNGMGLPVVNYPDGGDRSLALSMARAARAGEDAGVALPEGYSMTLMGVQGQTRDELPLLNYHDRAMGRNALTMFMDLGHENGARALGDTFLEFFLMAEEATADYVGEITTEHVVRDLVRVNFGEDEPYPEVLPDPITARSPATAEAVKALVEVGVIVPDDDLEADIRRRYGLPSSIGTGELPDEGIEGVEEVEQPPTGDLPGEPEGGLDGVASVDVTDDPKAKPVKVRAYPRAGRKVRPHRRREPGEHDHGVTGLSMTELKARYAELGERLAELADEED